MPPSAKRKTDPCPKRRRTGKEHCDLTAYHTESDEKTIGELLDAASRGNVAELRQLVLLGVRLDVCDYDGRTALHLATAESKSAAVS